MADSNSPEVQAVPTFLSPPYAFRHQAKDSQEARLESATRASAEAVVLDPVSVSIVVANISSLPWNLIPFLCCTAAARSNNHATRGLLDLFREFFRWDIPARDLPAGCFPAGGVPALGLDSLHKIRDCRGCFPRMRRLGTCGRGNTHAEFAGCRVPGGVRVLTGWVGCFLQSFSRA